MTMSPQQQQEQLEALLEGESLSLEALQTIFSAQPDLIKVKGKRDRSWLAVACQSEKTSLEIVKYLVSLDPEAIKDNSFRSPLDFACGNPFAGADIIEHLIDLYPEALMQRSAIEGFPIHSLFFRSISHGIGDIEVTPPPLDLLRLLVTKSPNSVREKDRIDDDGRLPIHSLCEHRHLSLDALCLLVEAAPDTLMIPGGYTNMTPLHLLLESHYCEASSAMIGRTAHYLIEMEPAAVRIRNEQYGLPLHSACRNVHGESQASIVRCLVESYPESIHETVGAGDLLPLHSACVNDKTSSLECIRYLTEQFAESVRIYNNYGMKPIDYAIRKHGEDILRYLIEQDSRHIMHDVRGDTLLHMVAHNPNLTSIRYIYDLDPGAMSSLDAAGNMPLHRACSDSDMNVERLEFFLDKLPVAVEKPNAKNQLPFHVLCTAPPKLAVIQHLYKKFPEAIRLPDEDGRLPFHLACARDFVREATLQKVYDLFPEAISITDKEGNLPLHLVANSRRLGAEALQFVFRLYPDGMLQRNSQDEMPVHLMMSKGHISKDIFEELVDAYPEALNIMHKSLGLPLHCATRSDSRASNEMVLGLYIHRYATRVYEILSLPFHVVFQDRKLGEIGATPIAKWFFENYAGAVKQQDRQGRTSLRFAVTTKLNDEFLNSFIEYDDEAVRKTDKHGSLPLHYCLRHGDPNGCTEKLIDLYPESIHVVDIQGQKPIHNACRHGALVAAVQAMLRRDESLSYARDHLGDVPLHKACRAGDTKLIQLLIDAQPATIRIHNSAGFLPLFLLCQSTGKLEKASVDGTDMLGMVWTLMSMHPEAIIS